MSKDTHQKIKSIEDLAQISANFSRKGKVIVHCHGVFDLLHLGHVKHFEAAKRKGDILIVTVTQDQFVNKGPGRPVFNHFLRAEAIAALECVDYVSINEWPTAVETIKKLRPRFYVKGSDYAHREDDLTGKIYEEEQAVKSVGGRIIMTDEITFSSSAIINAYLTPYPAEAQSFLAKFKKSYSSQDIIDILKKVRDIKILVVGDIIIDEYHYCAGIGKSQKDNIIATKFLNEEVFAGGVLGAANHVAGFCPHVTLLSSIGLLNNYREFISTHLKSNIKTHFYYWKGAPTVVKRRFLDPTFLTKMLEICYLPDSLPLSASVEDKICGYLKSSLKNFDMVIAADFGHGLMTPRIIEILAKKANFLAVNVQTNSANLGYNLITKFPRADYVCIDEPEIRLACHNKVSDLKDLICDISKQLDCAKVIITRGHKGSLTYSRKEKFSAIPVFSREIIDRIGAGDAYFSVTSPCAYKDNPMEVVGFIGNAAAAMKILIVGNRSSVEPIPLYKYMNTLLK